MKDVIYTESERQKKYTVQDAVNAAKARVGGSICVNEVSGMRMDTKISLKELNEIADAICMDTYFYNN
jgi:hypothetical protein